MVQYSRKERMIKKKGERMNNILLENKMMVLERLVLQDIVANYGMQNVLETSYDELMARLLDRMTRFYE